MKEFKIVNLRLMLDICGEAFVKQTLAHFSCPQNRDVEEFLKEKAIDFANKSWAQTHLVFLVEEEAQPLLLGYFALANKSITVRAEGLSRTTKKRLSKFATFDPVVSGYVLSAPLIAQLGKNFAQGANVHMDGTTLLNLACDKTKDIQMDLGGRFTYVECENKAKLLSFYGKNGFVEFDKRYLDDDELHQQDGHILIRLLKYIH